ncbi:hypothetical protein FOL47_007359 [Perkinsus chesapeaki]|uniref:Uncharacterized protein n=1 Tax=Perkinsus chesapeaki TaxID=330153 RepID=A0A7J6LM54_PERCH|nr:hypothetical protein FOL47_007359 [Perkinsus chesapeaki]
MAITELFPATLMSPEELSARLHVEGEEEEQAIKGRLEKCRQNYRVKAAHLCGLRLNERTFPMGVLTVAHLRRLDLSHNNFKHLPEQLVELEGLRELWLDRNPLESVVSLHRLKHLRLLSLRDLPRLRNVPREYADLRSSLVDVGDLENCPVMNEKLAAALQAEGMDGFFKVLEIKNIRREQERKLVKTWCDDLYPFDDKSALITSAKRLTKRIKADAGSPEAARLAMSRLIKHSKRIFPEEFSELDEATVVNKVKSFDEEDQLRGEVTSLQLRIKAAMPDLSGELTHSLALEFKSSLSPTRIRSVMKDWNDLFPLSQMSTSEMLAKQMFDLQSILERQATLHQRRELDSIRREFCKVYPTSADEEINGLVDYLMRTSSREDRKRLLVDNELSRRLPGTIEDCVRLMKEQEPLVPPYTVVDGRPSEETER